MIPLQRKDNYKERIPSQRKNYKERYHVLSPYLGINEYKFKLFYIKSGAILKN